MKSRVTLIAAVATLALVAAPAGASSTVNPRSGAYAGSLAAPRTGYIVSLQVAHGRLTKANLSNFPIYCSGGGPPIPIAFAGAKIAKTGKFTTKSEYEIKLGPLKGKIGDRFVLSGVFTSRGTVSGKLETANLDVPACGGTSAFSAKLG